jgi:hypothetical protein
MNFSLGLSRWKPRHLLAAWSAYWAGLILVKLGPVIVLILRVALPAGAKGSVAAAFGDGGLRLDVTNAGANVWTGSISVVSLALLLGGPPLLLWLAWLMARPARPLDAPLDVTAPRALSGEPFPLNDRERPKRETVDRD